MDVHFSSADLQNALYKLLLDMDDCANRDAWWYCEWWRLQDIYIYMYISVVLPAGSSQGKLEKKSPTCRLKTNLIISGFESKLYPSKMDAFFTKLFLIHQEKSPENEIFRQQKIADSIFPSFPSPIFWLLLGSAIFLVVFGVVVCSKQVSFSPSVQGV